MKRSIWTSPGAWATICLALVLSAGCTEDQVAGCVNDLECRGDRICVQGVCQAPEAEGNNAEENNRVVDDNNEDPGPANNVSTPDMSEPDLSPEPDFDEPDQDEPDFDEPDQDEPDLPPESDFDEPDFDEPDVVDPDFDEPDFDEPDQDEPDFDEPDFGESDFGELDFGEPDSGEDPDLSEPTGPQIGTYPGGVLDFGEVGRNVSVFENIVIINLGDGRLDVDSVRLENNPSQGFEILGTDVPFSLEPGEEEVFRVRFQPTFLFGESETPYGNVVIIESNDADDARVEIALEGVGVADPEYCLTFDERTLDFGALPPGEVEAERLELQNCGDSELTISAIRLEGDTPDVTVRFGPDLPFVLGPGDDLGVVVDFLPSVFRTVRGSLVAEADNARAEVTVLSLPACVEGDLGAEGGLDLGDRVLVQAGEPLTFDATGSEDPAEGGLVYTWTILSPESGQDETFVGEELGLFSWVFESPGLYTVELTAESVLTGASSCEVERIFVEVLPPEPAARITVTWNNQADLDLHVVRSDVEGAFGDFGSTNDVVFDDCYFGNRNPDWGVEGVDSDNPIHVLDDTDGLGPEIIVLPELEPSRGYRIGVNYARRNFSFDVTASVVVELRGEEPIELEGNWNSRGRYFVPFVINGDGTLTEVNEIVEP